MNIDKNMLKEILSRYYPGGDASDACNALWFVHDLFAEEAKATEQKEPSATRSIDTMQRASTEIMYMMGEVEELLEE